MSGDYPYIWTWDECSGCARRKRGSRCADRDVCSLYHPGWEGRKGTRCRVLARGAKNTALVEFQDGYRTTVSRNGLRKGKPSE